jgi:hypothetical protein
VEVPLDRAYILFSESLHANNRWRSSGAHVYVDVEIKVPVKTKNLHLANPAGQTQYKINAQKEENGIRLIFMRKL